MKLVAWLLLRSSHASSEKVRNKLKEFEDDEPYPAAPAANVGPDWQVESEVDHGWEDQEVSYEGLKSQEGYLGNVVVNTTIDANNFVPGQVITTTRNCATGPVQEEGGKPNTPCVFPFKYGSGEDHYACILEDNDNTYWCSTKVGDNNEHVGGQGEWGNCNSECPITEQTCTCDNGTAAINQECPTANEPWCTSCNEGFYLDPSDGTCCKKFDCHCPGGVAAQNENCPADGLELCESCDPKYYRERIDPMRGHYEEWTCIKRHICLCEHGTADQSRDCPADDAQRCTSCEPGFQMDGYNRCMADGLRETKKSVFAWEANAVINKAQDSILAHSKSRTIGHVQMKQEEGGVSFGGVIKGLKPGQDYHATINTIGIDECSLTGGIFNPWQHQKIGQNVGDLGGDLGVFNCEVGKQVCVIDLFKKWLTLSDQNDDEDNIVGRTFTIYEYDATALSMPDPIACGIIYEGRQRGGKYIVEDEGEPFPLPDEETYPPVPPEIPGGPPIAGGPGAGGPPIAGAGGPPIAGAAGAYGDSPVPGVPSKPQHTGPALLPLPGSKSIAHPSYGARPEDPSSILDGEGDRVFRSSGAPELDIDCLEGTHSAFDCYDCVCRYDPWTRKKKYVCTNERCKTVICSGKKCGSVCKLASQYRYGITEFLGICNHDEKCDHNISEAEKSCDTAIHQQIIDCWNALNPFKDEGLPTFAEYLKNKYATIIRDFYYENGEKECTRADLTKPTLDSTGPDCGCHNVLMNDANLDSLLYTGLDGDNICYTGMPFGESFEVTMDGYLNSNPIGLWYLPVSAEPQNGEFNVIYLNSGKYGRDNFKRTLFYRRANRMKMNVYAYDSWGFDDIDTSEDQHVSQNSQRDALEMVLRWVTKHTKKTRTDHLPLLIWAEDKGVVDAVYTLGTIFELTPRSYNPVSNYVKIDGLVLENGPTGSCDYMVNKIYNRLTSASYFPGLRKWISILAGQYLVPKELCSPILEYLFDFRNEHGRNKMNDVPILITSTTGDGDSNYLYQAAELMYMTLKTEVLPSLLLHFANQIIAERDLAQDFVQMHELDSEISLKLNYFTVFNNTDFDTLGHVLSSPERCESVRVRKFLRDVISVKTGQESQTSDSLGSIPLSTDPRSYLCDPFYHLPPAPDPFSYLTDKTKEQLFLYPTPPVSEEGLPAPPPFPNTTTIIHGLDGYDEYGLPNPPSGVAELPALFPTINGQYQVEQSLIDEYLNDPNPLDLYKAIMDIPQTDDDYSDNYNSGANTTQGPLYNDNTINDPTTYYVTKTNTTGPVHEIYEALPGLFPPIAPLPDKWAMLPDPPNTKISKGRQTKTTTHLVYDLHTNSNGTSAPNVPFYTNWKPSTPGYKEPQGPAKHHDGLAGTGPKPPGYGHSPSGVGPPTPGGSVTPTPGGYGPKPPGYGHSPSGSGPMSPGGSVTPTPGVGPKPPGYGHSPSGSGPQTPGGSVTPTPGGYGPKPPGSGPMSPGGSVTPTPGGYGPKPPGSGPMSPASGPQPPASGPISPGAYGPKLAGGYGPKLAGGYTPPLPGAYGPKLAGGSTPLQAAKKEFMTAALNSPTFRGYAYEVKQAHKQTPVTDQQVLTDFSKIFR